jgi:hypothetical protein
MPEEKNSDSGFKVIDRRSFTADGTRREANIEEARRSETARPAERGPEPVRPSPARSESEFEATPERDFGEPEADFETLISYLSTTAMFQLGLLPGPAGERIPADLINARRTINLLEVLQQKTHGNLTQDEQRLLEAALYELRLSFVEVDKRRAKKGK